MSTSRTSVRRVVLVVGVCLSLMSGSGQLAHGYTYVLEETSDWGVGYGNMWFGEWNSTSPCQQYPWGTPSYPGFQASADEKGFYFTALNGYGHDFLSAMAYVHPRNPAGFSTLELCGLVRGGCTFPEGALNVQDALGRIHHYRGDGSIEYRLSGLTSVDLPTVDPKVVPMSLVGGYEAFERDGLVGTGTAEITILLASNTANCRGAHGWRHTGGTVTVTLIDDRPPRGVRH